MIDPEKSLTLQTNKMFGNTQNLRKQVRPRTLFALGLGIIFMSFVVFPNMMSPKMLPRDLLPISEPEPVLQNAQVLVEWFSECGCTGIDIEATRLLQSWRTSLSPNVQLRRNNCADWCPGLSAETQRTLKYLTSPTSPDIQFTIHVIHIAYLGICAVPKELLRYQGKSGHYFVARVMCETDRIRSRNVKQCNELFDEVWVPSNFNKEGYALSGVNRDKIRIVHETVDPSEYNPQTVEPLEMNQYFPELEESEITYKPYTFLSIFKWEHRKNWDMLLRSFEDAFCSSSVCGSMCGLALKDTDRVVINKIASGNGEVARNIACLPVRLLIKTSSYVNNNPMAEATTFINSLEHIDLLRKSVAVVSRKMSEVDIIRMYAAVDAFVLPTHGEGWGLPLHEAMCMGLPVIATGWGGSTEFMNDRNSYLIRYTLIDTEPGFKWAAPDRDHLVEVMRKVVKNTKESSEIGDIARKDMIMKFSGDIVTKELNQLISD
eukprot:85380_1